MAEVQITCLPDEWGQRAWAGHLCANKQKAPNEFHCAVLAFCLNYCKCYLASHGLKHHSYIIILLLYDISLVFGIDPILFFLKSQSLTDFTPMIGRAERGGNCLEGHQRILSIIWRKWKICQVTPRKMNGYVVGVCWPCWGKAWMFSGSLGSNFWRSAFVGQWSGQVWFWFGSGYDGYDMDIQWYLVISSDLQWSPISDFQLHRDDPQLQELAASSKGHCTVETVEIQ